VADTKGSFPSGARRAALFALLASALVALVWSDILHAWLLDWVKWAGVIIEDRPVLGKVLFVGLAAVSAIAAFVSSAVVVPVAVLAWGKTVSLLLLWTGWTLGGITAYGVSRFLGRHVVRRLVSDSLIETYEKWIPRSAPFGLILLFQTALPSEVPGYLLGLARYPFRKYLAALVISELPYAIATIYLGEGFLQRRVVLLLSIGLAMAVFSGWTLHWLRGRVQERR
jgi:uncharacterized membrane protein YdjX (TVP38/TMEM64 family)